MFRRKSPTSPTPEQVQGLELLLTCLRRHGVADFVGYGLTLRLGPTPLVEPPAAFLQPSASSGAAPPPAAPPLTPEAREALLSSMEEGSPLYDAVRSSA